MKKYTICFMVTGGVSVEADSYGDALLWFDSEEGANAVIDNLLGNDIQIMEIIEEEADES